MTVFAEILAEAQKNLLENAGCSWDSPLELPDRYLNSTKAQNFSKKLQEKLEKSATNNCILTCVHGMERVLPLWQKVLESQDRQIRHLLVVRHPLAVVDQFRQVNDWDRDRALLVWLQSSLAMERYSRGKNRVIIDGEQLSWDIDGALNSIEKTLKLALPDRNHKTIIEIEKERAK